MATATMGNTGRLEVMSKIDGLIIAVSVLWSLLLLWWAIRIASDVRRIRKGGVERLSPRPSPVEEPIDPIDRNLQRIEKGFH